MSDYEITDVETHIVASPTRPWMFVRVETDQGIDGIGEAMAHRKPEAIAAAVDEMAERFVIGADPFDTERIFFDSYRDEWFSDEMVNTTVISAIDHACWDIKGKALGVPVYELLGGSFHGDSLPAYANGWYGDVDGSPEAFAAAAERVVNDGYRAMKFDPFGTTWGRMKRDEYHCAIERVAAVREAVGPGIDLLIEGHGKFNPGMALEVARALEPHEPTFFEEPTPADNIDALARVARRSPVPIATGERAMSKFEARALLDTEIDFVQVDLGNTGGITEGKKIAGMAEAEHVTFAPHNSQGPVATVVCAHLCASVPNFYFQETFDEYDVDWKLDLIENGLTIENGEIELPNGPGLGIDLDMDLVSEYDYWEHKDEIDLVDSFTASWDR